MVGWKAVAATLSGRWQVPLAACAIIAAGVALYRVKPPKHSVPFDALVADILTLAEAGAYMDAANAAANLLTMDPPLPISQRATLHDALADVIYRQESLRGLPNRVNAKLLLKQHSLALACGRTPGARAAMRAGQAHEWLGDTRQAITAYRTVLEHDSTADFRRTALQGLVRLLDGQPRAGEERRQHIEALLAEEGVSPGYLWWALQHAIQEAFDHNDLERARELLTRHGERFKRSDLKGYYDYLWAWLYLHDGQPEQAEPLIERVDTWLADHNRVDADVDQAGFLPAMSRRLRGCIHLAEARPQQALECFEQALALQSHGNVLVATVIGQAEALSVLERHEAAREAVRATVARLKNDPTTLNAGQPRLRDAISKLFDERHEKEDYENALRYLELALELTPKDDSALRLDLLERLGRESEKAAKAADDAQEQHALHKVAANAYEQAADLIQFDEPRLAALLWASAGQFDAAGMTAEARRLLQRFVAGRSRDPRMPQALLRLGQAFAADGLFEQATQQYRLLGQDYPRLEEAARARLLTATCLEALGQEHYTEAENILRDLLEDEDIAPQSQVFRDALFELCDLLYLCRRYAPAISHMEDFLEFYPEDLECYRIRFMLADAYRRSAHALLTDEHFGPVPARQRVSRERLQRAAELFGAFNAEIDQSSDTDEYRALYKRLALFYRADCLFDLNEPATLDEALASYRQAAALYQGKPAALTAQVQIANIYLRLGGITEAARAIERARWLLGSVPDQAFTKYGDGMDRAAWDRFLRSVRSSHLFVDVFAGTQ